MKELLWAIVRNSTIVLYQDFDRYTVLVKDDLREKRDNYMDYTKASMSFHDELQKAGEYETSYNLKQA
jgi:heme oxygenase